MVRRPAHLPGATGVLMLPVAGAERLVAVHGIDRARAVTDVTDVIICVAPGATVEPLSDGDRYLGFVFANAETADACEDVLRRAWAALDVEISAGR